MADLQNSRRLFEAFFLIVHNCVSSQASNVVQIGSTGARDDMKASLLRHLDGVGAHVSGCPYREASRRLHIAQPAISQTVADLEQELGLKLFSRAKRVAQLTPVFAWSDELAVSRLYSMAASTTARIACPKVSSHGEASSPVRLCGGLIREIDGDAKHLSYDGEICVILVEECSPHLFLLCVKFRICHECALLLGEHMFAMLFPGALVAVAIQPSQ